MHSRRLPEGVRHTDVPHEFDGVEHDMSRSVTEGVLESIHDLPSVIDREAFVGDRWAGDVAAQAFEGVALMGLAARGGMEGGKSEPPRVDFERSPRGYRKPREIG